MRDRFLYRVSTQNSTDIKGSLSNGANRNAGIEETSARTKRPQIRTAKHIALGSARTIRQEEGWNSSTIY